MSNFYKVMQRWQFDCCQKSKIKSMGRSLFILLTILLVSASCSKPVPEKVPYPVNTLIGKWKYTEHYMSIGGPGQWYLVQPPNQTVEFKADGTFQSAASFSTTFSRYEITDSATVKFTPAPNPTGSVVMKYEFNSVTNTLLLYPVEPMCIEGCAYKFLGTTH